MRFPPLALVFALSLAPAIGCNFGSDDDDDDGLDPLSGSDLSILATDAALITGIFTLTSPAILDENYGEEDDCRDVTRVENGTMVEVDILLDQCPFALPGTDFSLTGMWQLQGDTAPPAGDVDAFLQRVRGTIPNLDDLLADAGDLLAAINASADYSVRLPSRDVEINDSQSQALEYDDDTVIITSFVVPFETQRGADADAEISGVLNIPRDGNGLPDDPIGEIEVELRILSGRVILERVDFAFDGTEIIEFETRLSGQEGTINRDTGEVTFE